MTIRKGSPYGEPGRALPADGIVVASDAQARAVLEEARAAGRPYPALGVVGGGLCRTLAGPGDESRLRSPAAVSFPVDLGQVIVDGRLHLFVGHVVARNRLWTRAVVAMNAQWCGDWNLGPRSHPNDGLVDVYDARLRLGDLWKVRRRLPAGAHLPHPRIRQQRAASVQLDLERPLPVWIDGERVDKGKRLVVRVEPDALQVFV